MSIAASDGAQAGPAVEDLGRRRAAGIYGAIITAAILDTAGGHVSTTGLVVSVVVTLLVYWIAAVMMAPYIPAARRRPWFSAAGSRRVPSLAAMPAMIAPSG